MIDDTRGGAISGSDAAGLKSQQPKLQGSAGEDNRSAGASAGRPVLLTIVGRQWQFDEDPQITRYVTEGSYYRKNDEQVITYRQNEQAGFGRTTAVLTLKADRVTLVWNGEQHMKMTFAAGHREISNLLLPEGVLSMGIFTSSLDMGSLPNGGEVHIRYALDTPGAPALNTRLDITYRFV